MPANPPTLYVIAGCNGAGKTTFATEFLPHAVNCLRFLNPDEIARGLSPLNPPAANVKAARILLREIHDAVQHRETFAIGNHAERTKLRPTSQERLGQTAMRSNCIIFGWLRPLRQSPASDSAFKKAVTMCRLVGSTPVCAQP